MTEPKLLSINKQIKLVIWDLDGTLIDSFEIYLKPMNEVAVEFGRERPDAKMLESNFHGSLQESFKILYPNVTDEQVQGYVNHFLSKQEVHYQEVDSHILNDALELATKLKNADIAQSIITKRAHIGRGTASPRSIVANSKLGLYIDDVVSGDDFGDIKKPDPRVAQDLLSKYSVKSEEIIVIGDQYVDAQLALNLGCNGIIVARTDDGALRNTDKLPHGWESSIAIVGSFSVVEVER